MSDIELQEMRRQMGLLKEKLSRQEIVNDQLLRRTVESKLSRIGFHRKIKRAYIILCIIFLPALLVKVVEMPVWFAIATVAMLAVSLVYHEAFMEHISADDLNRCDLLAINHKALRLKEQGAVGSGLASPCSWHGSPPSSMSYYNRPTTKPKGSISSMVW